MANEQKTKIADAVLGFHKNEFFSNSLGLFKALGYNTSRSMQLSNASWKGFQEDFEPEKSGFKKDKAFVDDWNEVQLLFQLSAGEMQEQLPMFKETVNRDEPASFLFFAIELLGNEYSRSQLASIAREINKPFPMDVFMLFKYGSYLTLSLIERRPNKNIYNKDVIEKVTHIYNINIAKPHAAHIHILYTFSFEAIEGETRKKRIESFKDLQTGWKKIVSTQILNKQFYIDYKDLSINLIRTIHPKQISNKLIAHQGVLNLLNRIMFIYFVQKKKWIMGDDNFIINFWQNYLLEGYDGKNLFHEKWLNSVFFSAFNGQAYKSPKALEALPEPYKSALIYFPYLNGGLFSFHKEFDDFILPDKYFHNIFKFFEGYIFTITEDTPYDVNLEINPELLGKMYEGMINATDLNDVDAEHGIIYTERPEINFMVRRSFVEVFDKKLNNLQKNTFSREFLYHFIFDKSEEKIQLLKKSKNDINALRKAITSLTACDPACGSGSMILGVIQVQMELLRAIDEFFGKPHSHIDDFIIKKQLISDCIYGVDIKEWAVRIAELRLWLYMIAEAEFKNEELINEPLLPNLDFKLRQGNSLLQKFGDLNFTVEDLFKGKHKTSGAAKQLNDYIKKKKAFILNQAESKETYETLKQKERAVFLDLIREMITEKEQAIQKRKVRQGAMFGGLEQKNLFEEETITLKNEIEQLKMLRQVINKEKRLPFSFDIDFMEVFLVNEDNPGFDLVIGNPPYVRQEQILPPEDGEYLEKLMKPVHKNERAKVSKEYKEELTDKIYKIYPFLHLKQTIKVKKLKEFKEVGKKVIREIEVEEKTFIYGNKVPGRSDLYVYFQLMCPHYLNSNGTFCFIISNSWLDVDFGSFVQHFLLKHTNLYAVYDCNVRSFEAAVNTIIYLHNTIQYPPLLGGRAGIYKLALPVKNTCNFVMNKINYTQAAYAPLLIDQEDCRQNTFTEFFRCIPMKQEKLYINGYDEEDKQYNGDKWGSKFLRAPEIFYTILDKGKRIIKPINEISNVDYGVKTGANDFFYLDEKDLETWTIEKEFLIKVFKSPKDTDSIEIKTKSLRTWMFLCDKSIKELKGTIALKYILWGEKSHIVDGVETRAFNLRPSCNREKWYSVPIEKGNTFWAKELRERLCVFTSINSIVADCRLYMAFLTKGQQAILNSTFSVFIDEVLGRQLGGGGGPRSVMVYEVKNLLTIDANFIKNENKLEEAFSILSKRTIKPFLEEIGIDSELRSRSQIPNPLPDRKALDDIVFDAINLTTDERNEVYWSVAELVKQRLDKAASR